MTWKSRKPPPEPIGKQLDGGHQTDAATRSVSSRSASLASGGNKFYNSATFSDHFSNQLDEKSAGSSEGGSAGFLAPANDEKERVARMTEDMTINKLHFSALGLIGRSEETKKLKECALKCKDQKSRGLVLISGESGTGKTVLAKSMEEKPIKCSKSLFLSGKFDLLLKDRQPYAGIAGACRELCGELLYRKEKEFETLEAMRKALGSELTTLMKIVPEFQEVFDTSASVEEIAKLQAQQDQSTLTESKNQLRYAFRRLFQILGQFFPGLVSMSLDDLQWADSASLELLELILKDDQVTNLLVVGCYRSDEVDETHVLSQTIKCLKEKADEKLQVSEIHIGNLEVSHVKEILMELLSHNDSPEIERLAQICHTKTLGNAFFLIHFLNHLYEREFFQYNFGKLGWTWKEKDIETKTSATQNIIELLKEKMSQLPPHVGTLLAILACLGSESPEPLIAHAWTSYFKQEHPTMEPPELEPLLEKAVNEGFLLKNSASSTYRFVHDRVQETALAFVDNNKLPALKSTVGSIVLVEVQQGNMAPHFLFVAVALLNNGVIPEEEDKKIILAELNLLAAHKAARSSDFVNASQCIKKGVELVPEDTKWTQQYYNLTLELHAFGAEVESSLGRFEAMQCYCSEVLQQSESPLSEKYRVYNVMQDSLLNQGEPDEALELCLDFLKKLGYRFPRNAMSVQFSTVTSLLKILKALKKITPQSVKNLPIMDDPVQLEAMQVLDKASSCCYFGKESQLLPLVIMKSCSVTLKHGLCHYSPPAFAALALILTGVLGDFAAAGNLVDCIESIMVKLNFPNTVARTTNILDNHVMPWMKPWQTLVKPCLERYHLGLSIGDLESGMWSCYSYIGFGLQSGRRIPLLIADCHTYLKQMVELNQLLVAMYTRILLQVLHELTGEEEPLIAANPELYPDYNSKDTMIVEALLVYQSHLCSFLGDHVRSAANRQTNRMENPGSFWYITDAFHHGLSYYDQARATRKRRLRSLAKQQHALIRTWAKKGNPNVVHLQFVLDAEEAALNGRHEKARDLYQKGITMAARAGFIHDAALANERCAEYLLFYGKDKKSALFHLQEAMRYYSEWGAHGKVSRMLERSPILRTEPERAMVKEISVVWEDVEDL